MRNEPAQASRCRLVAGHLTPAFSGDWKVITAISVPSTQDSEGRFSLNDFHKAAGGEDRHKPANWLRLESTQALVEEISRCSDLRSDPVTVVNGGRNFGTFVCKELVYAYAMWISAVEEVSRSANLQNDPVKVMQGLSLTIGISNWRDSAS